jgi:hypothetical protein
MRLRGAKPPCPCFIHSLRVSAASTDDFQVSKTPQFSRTVLMVHSLPYTLTMCLISKELDVHNKNTITYIKEESTNRGERKGSHSVFNNEAIENQQSLRFNSVIINYRLLFKTDFCTRIAWRLHVLSHTICDLSQLS